MSEISVVILVEPGFIPTELSLVQDVLRIANRLSRSLKFKTQFCSVCENKTVEGLGGLFVKTVDIGEISLNAPDHFVVLGGAGLEKNFRKIYFSIRSFERKGSEVLLLSDAASEWKRLNPDDPLVTTHWENHQLLQNIYLGDYVALPLYSRRNRFTSGAGMMATADIVLNTIVAPRSAGLAHAVSRVLLMHAIRTSDVGQPRSENDISLLQQAGLERVIQLMEENLETPLSISVMSKMSGCSIRQLERRFQKVFNCTPQKFYRSLRLKRGKTLLEQTAMPISEISVSLGFSSSSAFSRLFVREYGITPSRLRALSYSSSAG
ncbi:GlxA family transcriptional regulator [Celeribacter halophilus]|uniref:GlxA family transcriptional regulator n=1 Tax=Celeribacter halophilus TaxID=576117 RepID=UPI001C083F29|nr:helix-turn-helix domain-containing protein [Celeribacter halophilus]MBU2889910.1 helix-turn-helix domain-containing protein [Celeribacter halophilus]MDO6512195.1 helix-turn-helix domain-containing protein [Celeribacter halophilus]